MRWQRVAQIAIAVCIVAFVGLIARSLRVRTPKPAATPPPVAGGTGKTLYNPRGGHWSKYNGDKKVVDVDFGEQSAFPDGRMIFSKGIKVTTNRNGKDMVVNAQEADVALDGKGELKTVVFRKDVRLTSGGGMEVAAQDATYNEGEGMVKIPGPVEFTKGRAHGTGKGATYDRNREVFWILEQAEVKVAPGPDGKGALTATSASAGLARAEHYMRLTTKARIVSEGRVIEGDEITISLTEDEQRVRMLQARGNSRITGGPQAMNARDIDLTYADDGRTLQHAQLVENAVLQLPGTGGAAGKRIAGKTIDIGLGPDGSTVTNLNATENVQVDLPAENNQPAKRIRSAALVAAGAPGAGLQQATFNGKVEFRETQAARRNAAAVDRTTRSETLMIDTKPGLGAVEKADFRGNVKIVDVPSLEAESQRAIYYLDRDRVELMPSDDPGPSARLNDGKMSVSALRINFTLGTRELEADTKVKTTFLSKQGRTGSGQGTASGKVPSMLKDDEPVYVTSNRLKYTSSSSIATYTGNARLWQGNDTQITADTIVLDDKNGNLTATVNVSTLLTMDETDSKTGQKQSTQTTGKSQQFVYDEAKRLATYTIKADITGPEGHVTGAKIELFLKPAGTNELNRAEAYAASATEQVMVREGLRTAYGMHLTYTAQDDNYLMVGTPVTLIEEVGNGECNVSKGSAATFNRAGGAGQISGHPVPATSEKQKCSAVKR